MIASPVNSSLSTMADILWGEEVGRGEEEVGRGGRGGGAGWGKEVGREGGGGDRAGRGRGTGVVDGVS